MQQPNSIIDTSSVYRILLLFISLIITLHACGSRRSVESLLTISVMCLRIFTSRAFNANKSFFPRRHQSDERQRALELIKLTKTAINPESQVIFISQSFTSVFFFRAIFRRILTSCRARIFCVRYSNRIISHSSYQMMRVCASVHSHDCHISETTHVAKTV